MALRIPDYYPAPPVQPSVINHASGSFGGGGLNVGAAGRTGVKIKKPAAPAPASRPSVAANGRTGVKIKKPVTQPTTNHISGSFTPAPKPTVKSSAVMTPIKSAQSAGADQSTSQTSISPMLVTPQAVAPAPAPVPTTETITIPDAKADAAYQQQVAALAQALTDYQSQNNLARTQYNQQYDDNLRQMGFVNNAWDTQGQGQYGQDFRANQGDFAGRGAYNSGVYANAVQDLGLAYSNMKSGLSNARDRFLGTQDLAMQQYQNQNNTSRQAALSDAVARIAAQYGLDLSQVPQGTGPKQLTRPIGG